MATSNKSAKRPAGKSAAKKTSVKTAAAKSSQRKSASSAAHKELLRYLISLETKVVTLQAMVLSLAKQSGFKEADILSRLDETRLKVMREDPSPVEVDPET